MSEMQFPPLARPSLIDPRPVKNNGILPKSYSISCTNIKYNLPAVDTLQSGVESQPGKLDIWPANAEGPTPPVVVKEKPTKSVEFLPKGNPKPRFLNQLETFLQKELKALHCTEKKPSEKRLQVFREVFENLIEDFKTYRPLLSAIKNEYEMMLIHLRDKIRELEPLKAMLVTVSEKCEKSLLKIKEEEKEDLQVMKDENKRLQGVIRSLQNDKLMMKAQVEKLQDELGKEYLKYRNECDARKLLIADINDLRAQHEDMARTSREQHDDISKTDMDFVDGKSEDPVFLRIALKKAREDIELKNNKLAQMEADYGDVVPRRDYEKLKESFHLLENDLEKSRKDQELLMNEHSALLDTQRKMEIERKEYVKECENMRRCATPRPRWEKCGQYIEGGVERWKEISRDQTSDVMVDLLLAEITGTDVAVIQAGSGTIEEFFEGLGTGANVPKYLRCDGKIRNKRISKRDALLLIKDVWQERRLTKIEKSDPEYESLPCFLHTYLERRYGAENLTFEWAYNLHDACVRYQHDPRISMFNGILLDEIDESVYHDQRAMFERLSNSLKAVKKEDEDHSEDWSVTKDVLKTCLQEGFQTMSETNITELLTVAESEMAPEGNILYKNILKEDNEGTTTLFMDKIVEFDRMERIAFVKDVENSLPAKREINEEELRQAILNVNPKLPSTLLDQYVCRACPEGFTKADDVVDRGTVIKRLQGFIVRRF